MSELSQACCTKKPAEAEYSAQGEYIDVHGLKTYATGDKSADLGIISIYDIFGFAPQVLQGADILAAGPQIPNGYKYQVFVPDFFGGDDEAIGKTLFPMNTPEKRQDFNKWLQGPGNFEKSVALLKGVVKELSEKRPQIKQWGAIGYCWGAKIVSLATTSDSPLSVGAEVHPSFFDPADAPNIARPLIVLPSQNEDATQTKDFEGKLKVEHYFETFEKSAHGWMAARANLKDENERKEYERGYAKVLQFFQSHLAAKS